MAKQVINSTDNLNAGKTKINENFNEIYSFTGWMSRVDELNVIELTASIDNVVVITGTAEENGGIYLMDSNSKITPIAVGDVLQVDFACTFETPSGTDQSIDIRLKVDGVYYRGFHYQLTKGDRNDDFFSVSWAVPCGAYIVANGAEIVLNPTSAMNVKNRYISVVRTHKGK